MSFSRFLLNTIMTLSVINFLSTQNLMASDYDDEDIGDNQSLLQSMISKKPLYGLIDSEHPNDGGKIFTEEHKNSTAYLTPKNKITIGYIINPNGKGNMYQPSFSETPDLDGTFEVFSESLKNHLYPKEENMEEVITYETLSSYKDSKSGDMVLTEDDNDFLKKYARKEKENQLKETIALTTELKTKVFSFAQVFSYPQLDGTFTIGIKSEVADEELLKQAGSAKKIKGTFYDFMDTFKNWMYQDICFKVEEIAKGKENKRSKNLRSKIYN